MFSGDKQEIGVCEMGMDETTMHQMHEGYGSPLLQGNKSWFLLKEYGSERASCESLPSAATQLVVTLFKPRG
jgi:hypothetical protein